MRFRFPSPARVLFRALPLAFFVLLRIGSQAAELGNPTNWFYMPVGATLHPTFGVGSWIWADKTLDQQTCRFWRAFEIPPGAIKEARLRITADNSFSLFLDGREIAKGGEWRSISEYDLRQVLPAGKHVFAIEAYNDYSAAGVLLGLRVELDTTVVEIASDKSWRVVPNDERGWVKKKHSSEGWPTATVIAAFGTPPWAQKPAINIRVPPQPPVALHFWQTAAFQITLICLSGIAVVMCLRLMAKLAIQSKAQEILQRERARIARDIHDDLGAGLTQLVLFGEVAQSERSIEASARHQFNEVSERARGLLRALNEAVWLVNSQRDTLRDFASYITKYAWTFLQATSIRCRFDVEPDISAVPLDLAIRRNLFLAVKEAIHNGVRHSQATELTIRIHRHDQNVVVVVADNGQGFDPATADRERNGLSNMQQRTREAGGECKIISRCGEGCRVQFTVPLTHPGKHLAWLKWRRKTTEPLGNVEGSVTTPSETGTPLREREVA